LNLFDRIFITAASGSNEVYFKFEKATGTYAEPDYLASGSNNVLVSNSWNYITASQREFLSGNQMYFEQQFSVANGRSLPLLDAGYDNTEVATVYPIYSNTLYLGAENDSNPKSFTGYLKEFKLFDSYHSFVQMEDEQLRFFRYYSFDDSHLIAYWKLSEEYTTHIEYTIYDYSKYQNSLTFSQVSDPDYPVFEQDNLIELNLCFYHDVKSCLSADYEGTHPVVTSGKKYTVFPTLTLNDLDHLTISDGDQLRFMPHNTDCSDDS
jgi:hypothetical protein